VLQGAQALRTGESSSTQSYASAEKAVELDDKNIKAYFLMGETLV
jgi:hypothetical protein